MKTHRSRGRLVAAAMGCAAMLLTATTASAGLLDELSGARDT